MDPDPHTREVIGAAIEVHRALGPGLLEATYESCLCHELALRGVPWRRQVLLPLHFKGMKVPDAYRVDILVGDQVVVELKAVEEIFPVHRAQVLTYLRLGRFPIGLLINFHVPCLREGIQRFVLTRT